MSAFKPGAATILTGPEGGFTDEERAAIRAAPNAIPISLGPRILRAETAALAALAAYMARRGRLALKRRPYEAINRNCWRGLWRAAKRRSE